MTARDYTCLYCSRRFSDPRGCQYDPDDERPVVYGSELYPLSSGPTCRDCMAPKGKEHHAYCLCTECSSCHNQFHPGTTCEEDAKFRESLPGTGAAA